MLKLYFSFSEPWGELDEIKRCRGVLTQTIDILGVIVCKLAYLEITCIKSLFCQAFISKFVA
jgi:hypothetical protein